MVESTDIHMERLELNRIELSGRLWHPIVDSIRKAGARTDQNQYRALRPETRDFRDLVGGEIGLPRSISNDAQDLCQNLMRYVQREDGFHENLLIALTER